MSTDQQEQAAWIASLVQADGQSRNKRIVRHVLALVLYFTSGFIFLGTIGYAMDRMPAKAIVWSGIALLCILLGAVVWPPALAATLYKIPRWQYRILTIGKYFMFAILTLFSFEYNSLIKGNIQSGDLTDGILVLMITFGFGRVSTVLSVALARPVKDKPALFDPADLRFTPVMPALLLRETTKSRRWIIVNTMRTAVAAIVLKDFTLLRLTSLPLQSRLLASLVVSALIGLVFWQLARFLLKTAKHQLWYDQLANTYRQYRGPVKAQRIWRAVRLRAGRETFLVLTDSATARALDALTWATVEYTLCTHVLFAVRDAAGQYRYALSGYEADTGIRIAERLSDPPTRLAG